jgi:hypothetical protein
VGVKTDYQILLDFYGDRERVARALGITERHARNIEKGKHIGNAMRRLIEELAKTVKTLDLDPKDLIK